MIQKYIKKIQTINFKEFKLLDSIAKKSKQLNVRNELNKIGSKTKNSLKISSIKEIIEKAQDAIEQNVKNDKDEIALNQTTLWAKGITWSIIGGSAFGLGWLGLAKTEEIVIAAGKLEPIGGVIEIQMPLNGITKKVLVEEGQKVNKGDILIKMDDKISEARRSAIEETYTINKEILDNLENLVEEGAVSKVQYLQQKNKVINLKSQITENNVLMGYETIKAPVEGYIFDLKPTGAGYVARTSQPVLKIVPKEKLFAKIEIPSRSIGFINVGKKADISIDSFPASDFGVLKAKVVKISSDALPPDRRIGMGYRFPAELQLLDQALTLENGKRLPLQVGMSLTANIKLRKVSYLQLLLSTFTEKSESLKSI